ncbi:MAG: SusC/RagA family TonB-linked outer membrane protein [Cyclobacteriaceae bacterium]
MRKILLLSTLFFFAVASVMAQRTVSGKVTDDTGEGLPGVNVVIKGTTNGTTTDLDGNFSLSVDQGATLVFSSVGFAEQEVSVGSRTVIDITLGSDVTELSEVVVTALGVERSEKALGYAVQEVQSDALVKSGAVNATDALVGKAAGIQITRSSGSAGGGSRILLRGVTSLIGNNQPIIVIDGVRTNNQTLATERASGTGAASAGSTAGVAASNRLQDLNVNDIENISVLKGAAATALYGTAGSTGVIVITTKKGKKGSGLAVNFSSQVAFDKITTSPNLQSIYAQGSRGAHQDPSTGASGSWGPRISDLEYSNDPDHDDAPAAKAFDSEGNYIYNNNGFLVPRGTGNGTPANTYDNLGDFYQTATTFTNSLSISGGNDVATFRFSASDHNQEGIVPNEEYLRKTASIATTLQATEALSFQATVNYSRSDYQRIQQGSNTSGLLLGLYRTPASFDNSNDFGHDAFNEPSSYIFANGAQRNYRGGGGYDNPYWVINNALRNEVVHRTFGSFQANYKVSDWINLGMNLGTDITNDDRKQNFEINSRTNPNGTIISNEYITRQTDFYLNLSGAGQLNDDFSLNYLVGLNMFSFNRHESYTQGDGLVFGGFLDISNTATISAYEDDTRYRTLGVFGQVETSWRNTAFVTLTARQDYDSRLVNPADFDAGAAGFFYPSISTALAFTELMPQNDILSFGKVRFSWAQVGAPPPNAYSTSTAFENTATVGDGWGTNMSWPINGVTAFEQDDRLGNPGLTPELTTSIEVGVDLRFLDGKVGLDVAYYDQKTEDAILPASVAPGSGFTSAWLNAGQLSTNGLEITLNATPVQSGDFNWDTQLNWSKSETIVDELAPGIERLFLAGFNSAGSYAVKGNQYGAIFGGAYLRTGAAQAGGTSDTDLNIPAGEVVINSDPTSAEYGYQAVDDTQRSIGNPNPDFILGWRNNLSYKNWSFGFLFDWRKGGDLWNGTAWALSFFGRSQLTADTREETPHILDGVINTGTVEAPNFVPNNIAIVRDQNYWTSALGGFGAIGEQFVQDGGWIKLREVNVSYSLPSSMFSDSFVKGITLGFVGRNLWYDWEYDGVDPETSLTGTGNGQGFDYFNNPSTRTFMFKLNASF